jgi:asparagine synthetase B (glutamine-hydrolysing)
VNTIEVLGVLNPNFGWDGTKLCTEADFAPQSPAPCHLRGAVASVRSGPASDWRLVRDPLGLNKLFWARADDGRVNIAGWPLELIEAGHHLDHISAIPRGCVIDLSPGDLTPISHSIMPPSWSSRSVETIANVQDVGAEIRQTLDSYLAALAVAYPTASVFVCLSGGLDSSGVAALAREHFTDVVAVSFDLATSQNRASQDRVVASRLARDLSMPLLEVTISESELLEHVDTVLAAGIDWRDFNVHAGLVNAAMAAGIAAEAPASDDSPVLVLTGDLANEFLADYHSESYGGNLYYELPRLSIAALRASLVRGLDTCHREIGVFAAWNLFVVQPYAVAADAYLSLGSAFLTSDDRKEQLCRHIFGVMVPEYVYSRPKVRAQAGSPELFGGVLAACADRGLDKNWLRQRFADLHAVIDLTSLDRFIRAGHYRSSIPVLTEASH